MGVAWRFRLERSTPAFTAAKGFEEKNGGVTGARVFADTGNLGALPTELFRISPEAGFEPATPALLAK